jgi:AmmeMemoRadiSam system protein B
MLEDLEGLSDKRVVLPEPLLPLLFFLLDGTRDAEGVASEWGRVTGRAIEPEALRAILAHLDDALLLEGDRVDAARREADDAYRALAVRPMVHAGEAYPREGAALLERVAQMRRESGIPAVEGPVRAVLAPHIDPRGGGPCHGAAIAAMAASPAEVFVVLGTAHQPLRRPFALTTKDFETPAGTLGVDRDLALRLASRGGGDLLSDERMHLGEHSVEFQAAWIRGIHADRPAVRIVPVLVGSLHERIRSGGSPMEDAPVRDFVEALREVAAEEGERIAFVASVDFAHVGPAYGHDAPPDETTLEEVMAEDRRLLEHARGGDAEGWIGFLQHEQDRRNVCGAAPTYVFLRAIEGLGLEGEVLRHDLWEIHPESRSHVSFAAIAYR